MKVTRINLLVLTFLALDGFAQGPIRNWEKEDNMALSITATESQNIASLVSKIKSFKTDEWGKFRIAFRWVAEHISYDYASFKSGNIKASTPDQTIKSKRAVCQGYSELLQAIADGLGTTCYVVTGYAKGYGYNDGDRFTDTNHAWNIAEIGGHQYLFDVTWAEGYSDKNDKPHKRFEDFYFAPHPEEFLFGHLPKEPEWQLVANPISQEEFERRSDIRVYLFKMGLSLESVLSICPTLQQCAFVHVNPIPNYIVINKAEIPFEQVLSTGKTYSFALYAPKGSEFFVLNQKNISDAEKKNGVVMMEDGLFPTIVPMVYQKGIYKATIVAKSGDLMIYAKGKATTDYLFFWKVK